MENSVKIKDINERQPSLIDNLTVLWEQSVRVSHHFLSDADIENLRPFVKQGLTEIPVLAVAILDQRKVGFIGIADRKVEMLFVAPEYIGRGIGRTLMNWGITKHQVNAIDVNEQNPHALSVYTHWGFKAYERTELDNQGNPFPIIKMRLLP